MQRKSHLFEDLKDVAPGFARGMQFDDAPLPADWSRITPQSPTSGVIDLRTILVGDDILFEDDEDASTKETNKSNDKVRVDVQTPADHVNIDDVIKVRTTSW